MKTKEILSVTLIFFMLGSFNQNIFTIFELLN